MSGEQQHRSTSLSMVDLNVIYRLNEEINQCRSEIVYLSYNKGKERLNSNRRRMIRIEDLQFRINQLTLIRHDQLMRIFSNVKITRKYTFKINSPLKMIETDPEDSLIQLITSSEVSINDEDIVYPEGVKDFVPYKSVARYRRSVNQSTNFRLNPLLVGVDSRETLIIGLQTFVEEHGSHLILTGEDQQFLSNICQTSSTVIDLSSIHLLANRSLLTVYFQFEFDLDYDKEMIQSKESVEQFVLQFCKSICRIVHCHLNQIKVFSITKFNDQTKKSEVDFGLTTSDQRKSEELARHLQENARLGFPNDEILRHVKPGIYQWKWKSLRTDLLIRSDHFDSQYNFDYKDSNLPSKISRGGYPYYLPLGWYRHSINLRNKYPSNDNWLASTDTQGEWPVAFHGRYDHDQPGLDVSTHWNGQSHPQYTIPFTVTSFPNKSEQFFMIIQSRIEPHQFAIHHTSVHNGNTWRIIDPNAIRPYGILIKKRIS